MSNRYTFRFQSEKCIQCHACSLACQSWNGTAPGLDRRWLEIGFQGSYPKPRLVPAAMSCLHCSDPACLSACPTGALTLVCVSEEEKEKLDGGMIALYRSITKK